MNGRYYTRISARRTARRNQSLQYAPAEGDNPLQNFLAVLPHHDLVAPTKVNNVSGECSTYLIRSELTSKGCLLRRVSWIIRLSPPAVPIDSTAQSLHRRFL